MCKRSHSGYYDTTFFQNIYHARALCLIEWLFALSFAEAFWCTSLAFAQEGASPNAEKGAKGALPNLERVQDGLFAPFFAESLCTLLFEEDANFNAEKGAKSPKLGTTVGRNTTFIT